MVYGIIVSAGRQSRFKSDVPKALAVINGKTLLERNIESMSVVCDKVYVVCSYENESYFGVDDKIVINSGKGSGDAVWQALETLKCKRGDTCFIMWGDTLHGSEIFSQLQRVYNDVTLIPCVYDPKPYVQIMQNGADSVKVAFSKFGEEINEGYHDLSLFYGPAPVLLNYLREFRQSILQADGMYKHVHGNEMEFLDVFNETDIKAKIVDCNGYKDFSFNTKEQLQELISEHILD